MLSNPSRTNPGLTHLLRKTQYLNDFWGRGAPPKIIQLRKSCNHWRKALYLGMGWALLALSVGCSSETIIAQAEARNYVGTMNRGQEAFYIETGTLSDSLEALQIGVPAQTEHYRYFLERTESAVFSYGVPLRETELSRTSACFFGLCWRSRVTSTSVVGAVFILPDGESIAILCSAQVGIQQLPEPFLEADQAQCPEETEQIGVY